MFKIVIIGSAGTGKTNIATRYILDQFSQVPQATIGVQFLFKVLHINDQKIKVNIWDTAGQQRFKALNKFYFKGASGVLIVYDVNDPQSYLEIESHLKGVSISTLIQMNFLM